MEYLIVPNNADVFIHTWHDPNAVGKKYESTWSNSSDIIKSDTPERIVELYKPKSHLIEPPKNFGIDTKKYEGRKGKQSAFTTFSMFYSIEKANYLRRMHEKENQFQYDCVIRCRFDLKFMIWPVIAEQYDQKLFWGIRQLNHMNVPCFTDHFAFSNGENMNNYCNVFPNIDRYFNHGLMLENEILLGHHLNWLGAKLGDRQFLYKIIRNENDYEH